MRIGCGALLVVMSSVAAIHGQGTVAPSALAAATPDSWPMHNGDYSGRRFSELTTIDSRNVASLSLGWAHRIAAAGPAGGGGTRPPSSRARPSSPTACSTSRFPITSGRSTRERAGVLARQLALEGRLAHRQPRRRGARHQRLCLDAGLPSAGARQPHRQGEVGAPRSAISISSTTPRPRHSSSGITSSSASAATTSTFPATSSRATPRPARGSGAGTRSEPGTPEAKTWPSVEAMLHGGGMTWGSTTYDPELNLIYFGTGNPQPVINGRKRQGDNLYTESIVALNPDTGTARLVFPGVAARHARLGRDADACSLRRHDRWPAAEAPGAGRAQRLVLRPRS